MNTESDADSWLGELCVPPTWLTSWWTGRYITYRSSALFKLKVSPLLLLLLFVLNCTFLRCLLSCFSFS